MAKITATQACVALQDAFEAENAELGDFYARMVKGWVAENHINSLEFGVKPTGDGRLEWFVALNGEGRVEFEKDMWGDDGEDGDHSPKDPEKMHPVIKAAYARLGIEVSGIEMRGYSRDDTCIRYHVWTSVPDWLEAYDPKNKPATPHDGTLVAIRFDPSANWSEVPAYLMQSGSIRIPRASAEALLAKTDHKGDPVYRGFLENGLLSIARGKSPSTVHAGGNCEKITDFWGRTVDTWPVPKTMAVLLPRYRVGIEYPVNGMIVPEDVADEVAAQYGEMPWSPATSPKP